MRIDYAIFSYTCYILLPFSIEVLGILLYSDIIIFLNEYIDKSFVLSIFSKPILQSIQLPWHLSKHRLMHKKGRKLKFGSRNLKNRDKSIAKALVCKQTIHKKEETGRRLRNILIVKEKLSKKKALAWKETHLHDWGMSKSLFL